MRVIGTSALGLGFAAACVFGACTSSTTPPSPAQGADGAPPGEDAGTDAFVPRSDAAIDATADGAGDAGDAGDATAIDAALAPFTVISTIALVGSPTAMVFNPVTNTLYVALASTGDGGTAIGIAVIDGATNTVATTIAYPGDAAAPYPIVQLAIDFDSNTLYAADSNPAGQTLYVINGVTNAVTSALPIASDLAMQVDSTAHRVYVLGAGAAVVPDGGTNAVSPPTVTVIDDATNDAGAPLVFGDQAAATGSGIAVDPVAHHLFLCGPPAVPYSNGARDVAAVDTLDTTSGLGAVGAQQSFDGGAAIACLAGWGGAAVVTSGSGSVHFLGAGAIALPSGFVATAAVGQGGIAPEKASVVVFGTSSSSSALEIVAARENADGGVSISLPPTTALPGAGATAWGAVAVAGASGGVLQAYVTYVTTSDAGAAAPSVTYASILAH